jgi:hypothetical protein
MSPAAFGSELDVAIETLEAAIADEVENSTRVVLAQWLSELRGDTGGAAS